MSKIIGITGSKDVGKTYYASLIINLLVERGYKVGSIKHAHNDFDIDIPDEDAEKISTVNEAVSYINNNS